MKILYIGGIKSGKSRKAEEKALEVCATPVYLATTQLLDEGMKERIRNHKIRRNSAFSVIEEPKYIAWKILESDRLVLVECLSMWINNMLYYGYSKEQIIEEVRFMVHFDQDMVFVLNDVGQGLIGATKLERDFVDICGVVGQIVAQYCDEVYQVTAGIERPLK